MRQLPVVESTAAAFRSQGYRVEAHVLAVPGAVSALGTVTRYLGQAAGNDQTHVPSPPASRRRCLSWRHG